MEQLTEVTNAQTGEKFLAHTMDLRVMPRMAAYVQYADRKVFVIETSSDLARRLSSDLARTKLVI